MKKRFARLWPLHIFVTFLYIPFAVAVAVAVANIFLNINTGDRFSLFSFITNIFLVQSLNLNTGTTWNTPAWSISVEFYTYLIFAMLYTLPCIKKKLIVPIAISLISFLVLYFNSTMGNSSFLAIFRCTYSFFLGIIAFKIHDAVKLKPYMEVIIISIAILLLSLGKIDSDSYIAYLLPLIFFATIIIFSHQDGIVSKLLLNKYLRILGML